MAEKSLDFDPLIDVLVHTYNHIATVAWCLDSILEQTYEHIRITIIDDSSSDGTFEKCEEYAAKSSRVSVRRSLENTGSKIKALEACGIPEDILFWASIDGDDFWVLNSKIEEQLTLLRQNPEAVGCSGETEMISALGSVIGYLKPSIHPWGFFDYAVGRPNLYVQGSSILWNARWAKLSKTSICLAPREWPKGEWPRTLFHLNSSGKQLLHLDKVVAVYNFNGRGEWSSMPLSDRETINAASHVQIMKLAKLRYRLVKYRQQIGALCKQKWCRFL